MFEKILMEQLMNHTVSLVAVSRSACVILCMYMEYILRLLLVNFFLKNKLDFALHDYLRNFYNLIDFA